MRVHYLQHVSFEGIAGIGDWLKEKHPAAKLTRTKLFNNEPLPQVKEIDWLFVMGGPMNIYEETAYPWLVAEKVFIQQAIEADKMVFGVCLGAQIIADLLGKKNYKNSAREIGWYEVTPPTNVEKNKRETLLDPIFAHSPEVLHWHGETFDIPTEAQWCVQSKVCPHQGFVYQGRVVGLQFHLEMTPQAAKKICAGCASELLLPGKVQSAEEILKDLSRFEKTKRSLDLILSELYQRTVVAQ